MVVDGKEGGRVGVQRAGRAGSLLELPLARDLPWDRLSTIYYNDSPGPEPNKPKDLPKTSLPPLALPHWVPILERTVVTSL